MQVEGVPDDLASVLSGEVMESTIRGGVLSAMRGAERHRAPTHEGDDITGVGHDVLARPLPVRGHSSLRVQAHDEPSSTPCRRAPGNEEEDPAAVLWRVDQRTQLVLGKVPPYHASPVPGMSNGEVQAFMAVISGLPLILELSLLSFKRVPCITIPRDVRQKVPGRRGYSPHGSVTSESWTDARRRFRNSASFRSFHRRRISAIASYETIPT